MQRRQFIQWTGAALLSRVALPQAAAQTTAQTPDTPAWPQRPVRWVLSQPPGSGPDNVARLLAEPLAKAWGQAVVIDNKHGGQNTIGAQAAARSPADGHHFYFATTAALVTNPLLFKQLTYDPVRDFVPVAFIARSPFALLVEAGSPVRSLQDWVARSKAAPGVSTLGNEGPRTFSGLIARLLNARTQAQANLVPYASVGVGTQDLIGGHVQAMVADLASTAQLVRQGRLRLLATTSARRVAGWDGVPTLAETLPGFEMVGWFVLVAPAGTPAAVLQRVNGDINRMLADPALAERIAAIGPLAESGADVAQVGDFLKSEQVRWARFAREIDLVPE